MEYDVNNPFCLMQQFIPEQYWKALMYMGKQDGITLYKHCNTRMYINVDKDGRFYKYNGKGYDEIGKDDAISHMCS